MSFILWFIHHFTKCQWMLKLDSDAIMNIPKMKNILGALRRPQSVPYYVGFTEEGRLARGFDLAFNGGGTGYLLNREAIQLSLCNVVPHGMYELCT